MIARLDAPSRAVPNNQLATGLFIATALVFIGVRLFEAPANPATIVRVFVSLVAIGCMVLARRQSLLRKATIFFALEALGGVVAFAYVDVPFVFAHQQQIGHTAVAILAGFGAR